MTLKIYYLPNNVLNLYVRKTDVHLIGISLLLTIENHCVDRLNFTSTIHVCKFSILVIYILEI